MGVALLGAAAAAGSNPGGQTGSRELQVWQVRSIGRGGVQGRYVACRGQGISGRQWERREWSGDVHIRVQHHARNRGRWLSTDAR